MKGETKEQIDRAMLTETKVTLIHIRPLIAALSCVAAAWVVAGSTGLLVYPLRRAISVLALAIALVLCWPFLKRSWMNLSALALVICISTSMVASTMAPVNIAAIAVFLLFLALMYSGPDMYILLVSGVSVVVFTVYRLTLMSIPWVWLSMDLLGQIVGRIVGLIVQRPLWIGATFAGLDFLVLTGTVSVIWLAINPRPRRIRALYILLALLGGHLCYLLVLPYATDLVAIMPKVTSHQHWSWAGLLHKAVPWNLPTLACVIHLLMMAAFFRWGSWSDLVGQHKRTPSQHIWRILMFTVACIIPVVTGLYSGRLSLEGKKVVFYDKTYVNWLKPTHESYGRLSGGMCGMLPAYVETFGAKARMSAGLTEEDLKDADILVVYCPSSEWTADQLECVWEFVRKGGGLLVMGEHTIRDSGKSNRVNNLLKPIAVHVPFDSAMFAAMGWNQSYEVLVHPITAGLANKHNDFAISIGASLDAKWPSCPVLTGRWGWTDFGDESNSDGMLGNWKYDLGEKLGDIVMVAEQPLGLGRVIIFGDTSSLMNTSFVSAHEFVSRLLAYLARPAYRAHPWWRQVLGLLLSMLLITILIRGVDVLSATGMALGLVVSLLVCSTLNHRAGMFIPDGRIRTPNNLAYIDMSHVEAYCDYLWRSEDAGGLVLTLMRNGYLPFSLPELTIERLKRAALLISIAPSRAFSDNECAVIRQFVTNGGTFIITVGNDEVTASVSVLSEFGFAVGRDPVSPLEPEPMGRFKSPYLQSGDRYAHVRFHAAWPVWCKDPNAHVIANGRGNIPVIVMRRVGAGKVAVIGDTGFAMNKNLERHDGQLIEGQRENADFWRWFVTQLRDQDMWIPPSLRSSLQMDADEVTQEQHRGIIKEDPQ